jgi:phospholipid/cholesterol/gamma-HCH transport system ATP-binding protein
MLFLRLFWCSLGSDMPGTDGPIIDVRSIVSKFGNNFVHRGVSFAIEKPGIVALIGGSGCGKSVLLKEIIGLLRPTEGRISIQGLDVWSATEEELNSVRNRFGVLFQNGALFSALNVAQNVAVPLCEQTHLPSQVIDQLVELRLALSDLPPGTGTKMPSELSGGMRKRVALARALALEPEILFLDEPTSGLDPVLARSFDALIQTLSDSLRLTVVMVTHDLDTLSSIVDRLIVLGDGRILADGPVKEVEKVDHPWIQSYFSSRRS